MKCTFDKKGDRQVNNHFDESHKTSKEASHKKCSKCDMWFERNKKNFYINKKNKIDGLCTECKACAKARATKWRNENLEAHKLHIKKYRSTEKGNGAKNRLDKEYRDSGKYKDWCNNNKNSLRGYQRNRYERKYHDITDEEWIACKEYFNNSCAYCDKSIEDQYTKTNKDFSRDHYINGGANDLSNCIPSCTSCNSRKWKHEVLDWFVRQKFYSDKKLIKIDQWISIDYKNYIK